MLDVAVTLAADTGKGGRANEGKGLFPMARHRYQQGSLTIRGKRQKVWVARWWEDMVRPDGTQGRVRRSEVIGPLSQIPNRREARKLLEQRLRLLNNGLYRPQSAVSFAMFVAEHFEPAVLPTLRRSTQEVYRILVRKHLLPYFGNWRLRDIGRASVQRFCVEKASQGQSWGHAQKLRNVLSRVLGTALDFGFLAENPARGIRLPAHIPKRQRVSLSPDEVRRLLATLDEPARTIALLATFTGLRISEILGLRWRCVDLTAGTVRVEETVYRGQVSEPKTRASHREIPLAPSIVAALARHRSRGPGTSPEALVFATRRGTPLSDGNLRRRELVPACQRAGLKPIGWHDLRHTFQSILHRLGAPLKVSQALLGHSRLTLTLERYTHATTDDQREAVARLGRILDPNGPKSGTTQETRNQEVQTIQ